VASDRVGSVVLRTGGRPDTVAWLLTSVSDFNRTYSPKIGLIE